MDKLERFDPEEDLQYRKIFGGVAWPGKRPGFVAILGQKKDWRLSGYDMVLLDEAEDGNLRNLVRTCAGLDYVYRCEQWIGDNQNVAADEFIRQMNEEFRSFKQGRRKFVLRPTQILLMKDAFGYIFPLLKVLMDKDRRRLFVREDSKLRDYMIEVEASQVADYKLSDWPAIAAMSFAALELEEEVRRIKRGQYSKTPMVAVSSYRPLSESFGGKERKNGQRY